MDEILGASDVLEDGQNPKATTDLFMRHNHLRQFLCFRGLGKNSLEEKVAAVERGRVALSDCILRIRVAPELQADVLNFFNSEAGRVALQTASHGVGARFITRDALLDMVIPGCRA